MAAPKHARWGLALALWMGIAAAAPSGDLRIEPVSLTLAPDAGAASLWLSNGRQAPLHAQVRIFAWTQQNGGEVLATTRDLAVSPPLLQVPGQGRQLVRVVRLAPAGPATETAYRLIVDELPAAGATDGGRLRYSIPVFLAPAAAVAGPRLSARIEADGRGQRHLRVDNSGDRHARIANLSFVGTGGREHLLAPNLAGYVLPGRYKHWPMPEDAGEPPYGRFQAEVDGTPTVLVLAPDLFGGR